MLNRIPRMPGALSVSSSSGAAWLGVLPNSMLLFHNSGGGTFGGVRVIHVNTALAIRSYRNWHSVSLGMAVCETFCDLALRMQTQLSDRRWNGTKTT